MKYFYSSQSPIEVVLPEHINQIPHSRATGHELYWLGYRE